MASEVTAPITLGNLRIVVEAQKTTSLRILQQQYGDGYLARRQDGINPKQEQWQMITPPMSITDVLSLENELEALGGGYFTWTPPAETTAKKWILNPVQWSRQYLSPTIAKLDFTVSRWYS